ncbi:F-box/kelch-repeat protein At3g23880-like [Solanum dulcamara]|uniref:F-box/kelch-repeat protein At3g23880-like n=1 Tax=Solanum dulcamara TaxID=45834 RepID=UPI002484E503|nr:F-box/kelch-repeat protein At3g23880-like [Solanum dulcamara]
MESEASHRHKKRSKHTSNAPVSSSSVQDSNFKSTILPEELVTEILLRLPVKSLLKFRCVSKFWLNLVTSPEFVKTHLSITANNKDFTHHRLMFRLMGPKYSLKDCSLSTFLYDSITRTFDLDYPMKNSCRFVAIVGSVNGLICLRIEEKDLVIWNPSIRKFKKLPDSLGTISTTHFHYMYGFDYDELADDYKVVRGLRNFSSNNSCYIEVQMYSLNSDSWRIIDHIMSEDLALHTGLFVNGKLHWVSKTSRDLHSYNDWDIISIDLADGKWGKVDKPCYGEGDPNFTPYMVVLGSDFSVYCKHPETFANLWVMKTYGVRESWTKISNINVRYPDCAPFCMSNNGDVLLDFGRHILVYNPKDNSITYPEVPIYDVLYDTKIYIENLVWPISAEGTKDATTTKTDQMKTTTTTTTTQ